jgi:asparagine synthase (glutamine-hydrolysing)
MCGITGWVDFGRDLTQATATIEAMTETLHRRGPDDSGTWTATHVALGHRRLAIIDPEHGAQPMAAQDAVLAFNGEIYNHLELRAELEALGHTFLTHCDTEVLLRGYLEWQEGVAEKLNGIFAFAVWDATREELLLVRDRLGVKPLFYYPTPDGVIFGSEPKAILANPLVERSAGREELCDALLFLRTPGRVPFKGMFEVKPGHLMYVRRDGREERAYWKLEAKPHTDSKEETIATIRRLLDDIVERQMMSDVPLCSLLSGGLDSSSVTALAQRVRLKQGSKLSTFCVDFVGHTEGFQADPIRPSPDGPFAKEVADFVGSDHHVIMLDKTRLLDPAVRDTVLHAWDLPFNFGDLDISLYLLFAGVREHATVALSGEAADELFGGYLWFSDEKAMVAETFPWLKLAAHKGLEPSALFKPGIMDQLQLPAYTAGLYEAALAEVPRLPGESPREARLREISYITLTRWLPILLEKKDRASMAVGLEGRVPFCDHRLVEYVFNIPWEMKQSYELEKGLLREAVRDVLPESVVNRKKAAYPTVRDSGYDRALVTSLRKQADDPASPLHTLLTKEGVERLVAKTQDQPLSEFERILVETTVRLGAWLTEYQVELQEGMQPCTVSS